MHRNLRRLMTAILTISLCLTGIVLISAAPAAAKGAPKLSAKSVMIAKGGRQTIKLRNGKGKWSVRNKSIVRIKKKTGTSVTLTPVKAGTTVLICKAGGKKLKCRVRVVSSRIGDPSQDLGYTLVVGKAVSIPYTLEEDEKINSIKYDKSRAKVRNVSSVNPDTGLTEGTLKIKALKAGRSTLYISSNKYPNDFVTYSFINGFRGKDDCRKTAANYKKWRRKTISTLVTEDMSTWEIIDAVGALISTGKYGMKGGTDGMQLWYGGNGTCVSGARMMNDFMKDLGIKSKVRFMGNSAGATDIYGYSVMYASQHRNTWITLGGKRYELNPQPGMPWPMGTVRR